MATSRRRRFLLLSSSLGLAAALLFSRAVHASPEIVTEIDAAAERWLDANATRRLIVLELAEVEVAPSPRGESDDVSLYYRIRGQHGGLRIELWERGELLGARTVSAGGAARQLNSRSAALTAAELARRADHQRRDEARRLARRRNELRLLERRAAEQRRVLGWRLRSGAFAELVGKAEAWQIGPSIEAVHTARSRLRLSWGVRASAGAFEGDSVQSLGVSAAPGYVFGLPSTWGVEVGLSMSASVYRLAEASRLDAVSGQKETWSALAGPFARVEGPLTDRVRFNVGPTLGLVLRRFTLVDAAGREQEFGGAFFGLSACALFAL